MLTNLQPALAAYDIVLASASPRRQDLLRQLGINFRTELKPVEESYPENLKSAEIAEYLAVLKADAFKDQLTQNQLLITGDTIVSLDDRALGKPKDKAEAEEMLKALSGRSHAVISSVCMRTRDKQEVFHDVTEVYFKNLSAAEIAHYITHFKPFDKAGAYGIQEWIGMIGVTTIQGSYFTVMGFPVHQFYARLRDFI